MDNPRLLAGLLLFLLLGRALPALGDGVFFSKSIRIERKGTIAPRQTRQEAMLAIHSDRITYVLATRYKGRVREMAWVIPLPATPTDVTAHKDNTLFDELDKTTKPRFYRRILTIPVFSCACAARGPSEQHFGLVTVEARGRAGIFDWAALTSTGSEALLAWLDGNGFVVPGSAKGILDRYIKQKMHFLALKVRQAKAQAGDEQIEIPPIQFTCNTTRRFYPMAISQISSAEKTEVVIYVIADNPAEPANAPNGLIDGRRLVYDGKSNSKTNYEALFDEKIAQLGGLALITEYNLKGNASLIARAWAEHPRQLLVSLRKRGFHLTRMRTIIARRLMTQDFEFRPASDPPHVSNVFRLHRQPRLRAAGNLAEPLMGLILFCLYRIVMRKSRR